MTEQQPDSPPAKPTHACDLIKEGPALTCPAGLPVPRGTVLTRRTLRSVAVLVLLGLLVTGANLLYTAHAVSSYKTSQQRARRPDRAETMPDAEPARRAETASGQPEDEPFTGVRRRAHATLAELGPDIGCKGR